MSFFQSLPRLTKTYHTASYDRIANHHAFDAHGKTVLVTGGAAGVGYSIVCAFARAGVARIVIVSRAAPDQQRAREALAAAYPHVDVHTHVCSVGDVPGMQRILSGQAVDVLVLNAAAAHRRGLATDIRVDEVQEAFDTNVVATFALTQMYLHSHAPRHKTVLNVSSVALQLAGYRVGYGSSKAAAVQVLQHFAEEAEMKQKQRAKERDKETSGAAGRNRNRDMDTDETNGPNTDPTNKTDDIQDHPSVKIVSFHPGTIWTPGTEKTLGSIFRADAPHWEDIRLPADFAVWLAGPESDFLHGRFVWAQWDVDELIALKDTLAKNPRMLKVGLVMQ